MPVLFHHDLAVAVLGSGSRGNCTYIGDGQHGLLVDCGLSTRQVTRRMEAIGLGGAPIDAVLVTHEHTDHVGGVRVLAKSVHKRIGQPIPVFMSAGTQRALHPRLLPERVDNVSAGRPFRVGDWDVEPFTVPHDTVDPVGYVVDLGPLRVGVFTDLGCVTRLVQEKLLSVDIAVLEFNHDLEMLVEGPYPWPIKQRIRSRHGHLSNEQAEDLLTTCARAGRLKDVILGHLSEENNSPEKALLAASRAVCRAGRKDIGVHVARQAEAIDPVRCQVPMEARPGRPASVATARVPSQAPLLEAEAEQEVLFES
ncbi:MAG: MBL fold metallo-hydrolase [Deltaproteobacteria bacterium]|nr:MBL fold metallo-hydrolase [Deltaproteobacteria bacterium]MBW2255730.1 MBL fold metallo-hydrolase [Deltaproteobacteria bacterium]